MPTVEMERRQVVVIGAGPSGAIAAALLKRKGHDVLIIERQHFPRFSIGESLLSHCLDFVEEAGMLDAVKAAGFQLKNGAAFAWGERYSAFDFGDTFSDGKPTTFQVQRADFDKLLADQAALQGVEVRYGEEIVSADFSLPQPQLGVRREDGSQYQVEAHFVLDASGYGRVLPRLLDLEAPSNFPVRQAVFTHVEDRIDHPGFEREKILVTTHPTQRDIWFWSIPFSNGRCSVGVVAAQEHFAGRDGDLDACLRGFISETPSLAKVLQYAEWDTPARTIGGYSANVSTLHGPGFALLGNAAEFLDPVFSSGGDHRHAFREHGRRRVAPAVAGPGRRLGDGVRQTAETRRGHLPLLRRGLVRRYFPGRDLPSGQLPGNPPHDQLDPRRLCLG